MGESERLNVGKSVPRSDGPAKVTGRVVYADDLDFTGLHGVAIRSPYPSAVVRGIDLSAVVDVPGAVTLTAADLTDIDQHYGITIFDQSVVAEDRVRYVGDIVAAVAAPTREAAAALADLIVVDYEPLPPVLEADVLFGTDHPFGRLGPVVAALAGLSNADRVLVEADAAHAFFDLD